ncbi:MAG: hypothetical protein U9Q74_08965 [Gemmatimonadota bacterium]|nr:hypothetical protein [Gemmatimonadota bacterium]
MKVPTLADARDLAGIQAAEAAYQRDRADRGDRQIRARKAVATRLRNRMKAGRCPCCSHRFTDLREHMRTEHPKWNPERAADALAAK